VWPRDHAAKVEIRAGPGPPVTGRERKTTQQRNTPSLARYSNPAILVKFLARGGRQRSERPGLVPITRPLINRLASQYRTGYSPSPTRWSNRALFVAVQFVSVWHKADITIALTNVRLWV